MSTRQANDNEIGNFMGSYGQAKKVSKLRSTKTKTTVEKGKGEMTGTHLPNLCGKNVNIKSKRLSKSC